MKKITSILAVLTYMLVFTQNQEAFNEIYSKTYRETAQKDMKKALRIADSLYQISETPLLQTKSLMLSATLYEQSGEVQKAIDQALRSGEVIEKTDNAAWQAKVFGFLASKYRMLRLYEYSKKYYEKAFSASERIENPEAANNIRGLMKQEKAYYEIAQKNYQKAITEIKSAQHYFDQTKGEENFFRLNNEQLLGLSFYQLGDSSLALKHYLIAERLAAEEPANFLTGLVYSGLAQIYVDKAEMQKAKKYMELAQKIAEESQFLALKNEVNTTSQKYYAATKDIKQLVNTKKNADSIAEKMTGQSQAFVEQSLSRLEKNKVQAEEKNTMKNRIILGCLLSLLAGGLLFAGHRRRNKKKVAQFKRLLKTFEEKSEIEINPSFPDLEAEAEPQKMTGKEIPNAEVSVSMTAETEKKILDQLQKFEEEQLFTDNKISLSSLATFCETNTKYLSFIINHHKKKDFNNYINNLRVNFIVKKLIDLPLYRKYKIGVLAEEAGFSSQNKFSTVFKKKTSISPSDFISSLEKTERE